MSMYSERAALYGIRCQTSPKHHYVGTTVREYQDRYLEHCARDGSGSKWTGRHGCEKTVMKVMVDTAESTRWENAAWMYFARLYGPENVRGGDVTILGKITPRLLPKEFGGERNVDWGDDVPELIRMLNRG